MEIKVEELRFLALKFLAAAIVVWCRLRLELFFEMKEVFPAA